MPSPRRMLRRARLTLVGFVLVVLVLVIALSQRIVIREYEVPAEAVDVPTDSASIVEGRRLATIRGCYDGCHGPGLSGNNFFEAPFLGRVTAPNLTRVAREYSDAELERVIRHGVKNDGRSVFVMPSSMFAPLSDEDLGRIIAFLRSEPEVEGEGRMVAFGIVGRLLLLLERFEPMAPGLVAVSHPAATPPASTMERGRYLGMTVCTECHGDDLRGDASLSPDLAVVAGYSLEQFRTLMRTGVPAGGGELDLMREVALGRFTHFTDEEIADLYGYLRTLPMGDDAPDALFAERTAVYLEATPDEIAEALGAMDEEDAEVVGDDLMFYRATSRELLEQAGWSVVTLDRGSRVGFVVEGETHIPDLASAQTLDLVLLYDAGEVPKVVAPVEIVATPETLLGTGGG